MGIKFSPKNILTKVVELGFGAFLRGIGVPADKADSITPIAGDFISGITNKPKSNVQKMQTILEKAIGKAFDSKEYELPKECYDKLINEFSIERTNEFLADIKPQEAVTELVKNALMRSPDCDISTLPLDDIAENMLKAIYNGIYENANLIDPIILKVVKEIKGTVEENSKKIDTLIDKLKIKTSLIADDVPTLTEKSYIADDAPPAYPPLLFSVGTELEFNINSKYYQNIHYVWCTTAFHRKGQPVSSDPQEKVINLLKIIFTKDRHELSAIINGKAGGIKEGIEARYNEGIIKDIQADIITKKMKNILDSIEDGTFDDSFFDKIKPVLYIIPVSGEVKKLCKPVPLEKRASPHSKEYIIRNLNINEVECEIIRFDTLLGSCWEYAAE